MSCEHDDKEEVCEHCEDDARAEDGWDRMRDDASDFLDMKLEEAIKAAMDYSIYYQGAKLKAVSHAISHLLTIEKEEIEKSNHTGIIKISPYRN